MPKISNNPAGQVPAQPEAQGAVAMPGVPAQITRPEVGRIYLSLDNKLGETLPGCGLPGKRPADVAARLVKNSRDLYNAGLTTPERVNAWMTSAWQHDLRLAAAAGVGKNVGYEAVMTAGTESFIGQLPQSVLNSPVATGAVVGLVIGAADVITGQILGSAAQAPMYNGRCSMEHLPPSVQPPGHQTVVDALRSAVLNVSKNFTRVVVPPIMNMIEHKRDGTVDTATADRIDLQVDGLGGMVAGVANEVLKLGPGANYMARMMLRDDLKEVLGKSGQSWGAAARDVAGGALQGALDLVKSPVAAGVITYFAASVTALLTANAAIDSNGREDYQNSFNASLPAGRSLVGTLVAKRLDSTAQMGGLTFGAPLVATGLQTAWDALLDKGAQWLTDWSMSRRPTSNDPGALEAGLELSQLGRPSPQAGGAAEESVAEQLAERAAERLPQRVAEQVAEQVAKDAVAQGVQEAAALGGGILSSHCETPTPPPASPAPDSHQRTTEFLSRGWRSAMRPIAPAESQKSSFSH